MAKDNEKKPKNCAIRKILRPEHFLNRELSWLDFNTRVLEEAEDLSNPLLARVKF